MTGSTLAVSGDSVWFGGGAYLWHTADGCAGLGTRSAPWGRATGHRTSWLASRRPAPVRGLPLRRPGRRVPHGMKVLVSFNGGRTEWQTRQAPPPQGDVAGFAVAPGGFVMGPSVHRWEGESPRTHPHRRDHPHHDTPDSGREHMASHLDRHWPQDRNSDDREPGANWPHTRIFSWPLAARAGQKSSIGGLLVVRVGEVRPY